MAIKVLFVDDDPNVLGSFRRNLRSKRDEIDAEFAGGPEEALEILERKRFDVIVADYKMPGMNGIELLQKVRERFPVIKRLLLTGQSQEEVFRMSEDVAHRYLSKPFETDNLLEIIKSL